MLIKAQTLNNCTLYASDGEIGKVRDFYFDDRHWAVRYLLADTETWLIGRQVLISPYALSSVNEEDRSISVELTLKQIEESPSLDTDKPVSRQFEEAYHGFFGWPMYWGGPYMWGAYRHLVREHGDSQTTDSEEKAWDPRLQSIHDVSGHHVQAEDGEIGHVDDFVIDDENWGIRYLIVDTRNLWPGKRVLISPQWIERVSWEQSKVFVNLSRGAIKESPEYTEESLLTRDYETRLHGHYNRQGYWIDDPKGKVDSSQS